jgi:FAD/FMN-containing dehydrogenase
VTVEAGANWGQVYDAVTTKEGRYVQGGGCLTVGVAGLIQSGGFGSFSKAYGLAAASLLEAEIVSRAERIVTLAQIGLVLGIKGGGGEPGS